MSRGPALGAFLNGLTSASVPSVVTAATVICAVFACTFLLLTPARLAGKTMGYLATNRSDYDAFVTSKVFALQASEDRRPLIALVGASVTRHGFGTERDIARAVREETGIDAEVQLLCTGRISLLDSAAIIDSLPAGRPTIVVLGVGPGRFTWSREDLAASYTTPRLGFRGPLSSDDARLLGLGPHDAGPIYFIDNQDFVLPRMKFLLAHAIKGPVTIAENRYTGQHDTPRNFAARSKAVMERLEGFDANFETNAAILGGIVERAAERPEMHLVLAEEAVNPAFVEGYLGAGRRADYLERMTALAAELDVPYLRIPDDASLSADDFFDWAHLSSPDARSRMRALLVSDLAEYLK